MEQEAANPQQEMTDRHRHYAAAYTVLREAIDAQAFPGCAFGVLAGDEVVLADALGRFTYNTDSPAITAETVFDVASLTKVVATTSAAMLLYQRGQIDLELPLADLLPGFVIGHASARLARRITLRHLLAHNSGLPGYVEFFRTASTPAELLRACLALPIEAEPGIRAEYSDPGFILLGKALEVVMRSDLANWTRREIFDPLGLAATAFNPAPSACASIPPTEIDSTFRNRVVQGEVQDENAWILRGVAGHAGLFSNVPDLLRFAGGILAGSRPIASPSASTRLFEPQTVQIFAERQRPESSSRALGWDTPSVNSSSGHYFSSRSIGHLGYSGCSIWMDLEADVAVVLLTNRTWPKRESQKIKGVRPAFHDAIREALG